MPEDFDAIKKYLSEKFDIEADDLKVMSYCMYPKVYEDYRAKLKKEGNFRRMGSDVFFHGINIDETCGVKIGEGKKLIIKLLEVKACQRGRREGSCLPGKRKHSFGDDFG